LILGVRCRRRWSGWSGRINGQFGRSDQILLLARQNVIQKELGAVGKLDAIARWRFQWLLLGFG